MTREKRAREPIARGVVVALAKSEAHLALAKETISILRALNVVVDESTVAPPSADLVILLIDEAGAGAGAGIDLPDLKDRAATAVAVGNDAPACRAALSAVRKRLRAAGATLGPHELVLSTSDFGYLGLESDGRREKLEILLTSLAMDAERLRLRREGWEEPAE